MINILYTINYLTNGGPTRVLQNIVKNLDLKKYKVTILTFIDENDKKIVENLKLDGIKIIQLKYTKSLLSIIKDKDKIIEIINKINPDIIHTHGIVSTYIIADKRIKSKKITTIHNDIFVDYKYTYGRIRGFIYSIVHIQKLKKFDDVVCCSKSSYEILKNRLTNVSYIRNGIDIKNKSNKNLRKNIRKELNIPDNYIVYVYGGVINARKRVVQLINLFSNNLKENERVLIVGDGLQLKEAKECANEKIIFTGFKENIIEYFQASDIYVSNSSSEGFSISLIEALNCGLLCLLSNIPSHKECFEINENYYIGEFFSENDFKEKKEKIAKNIKKINRKRINEFQEKYLSAKIMTSQYEQYYLKYI